MICSRDGVRALIAESARKPPPPTRVRRVPGRGIIPCLKGVLGGWVQGKNGGKEQGGDGDISKSRHIGWTSGWVDGRFKGTRKTHIFHRWGEVTVSAFAITSWPIMRLFL